MSACWRTKLRYHSRGKVGTLDLTRGAAYALIGTRRIRIEDRKHTVRLQQQYGWDGTCEIHLGDGTAPFAADANSRAAWGHLPHDQASWRIRQITEGATQQQIGGWKQLAETLFAGGGAQLGRAAYESIRSGRARDVTILSAVSGVTGGPGGMFTQQQLLDILARLEQHPAGEALQAGTVSSWKSLGNILQHVAPEHRADILIGLATRLPEGFTTRTAYLWGQDRRLTAWACTDMKDLDMLATVLAGAKAAGDDISQYAQTLRSRGILGLCAQGRPDAYRLAGLLPPLAAGAGKIALDMSQQALGRTPGPDGQTRFDPDLAAAHLPYAAAYADTSEAAALTRALIAAAGYGPDAGNADPPPDAKAELADGSDIIETLTASVATLAVRDAEQARPLARMLLDGSPAHDDESRQRTRDMIIAEAAAELAAADPELRREILHAALAPEGSTLIRQNAGSFTRQLYHGMSHTVLQPAGPGLPGTSFSAAGMMRPDDLCDMVEELRHLTEQACATLDPANPRAEVRLEQHFHTVAGILTSARQHIATAVELEPDQAERVLDGLAAQVEAYHTKFPAGSRTSEGSLLANLIAVTEAASAHDPRLADRTRGILAEKKDHLRPLARRIVDDAIKNVRWDTGLATPVSAATFGTSAAADPVSLILKEVEQPGTYPWLESRLKEPAHARTLLRTVSTRVCTERYHPCGAQGPVAERACLSAGRDRHTTAALLAETFPYAARQAAGTLTENILRVMSEPPETVAEQDWYDSCMDIPKAAALAAATGQQKAAVRMLTTALAVTGDSEAARTARDEAAAAIAGLSRTLPERASRHLAREAGRVEVDPETMIALACTGQPVRDRTPGRLGAIITAAQHPDTAEDVRAATTATQLLAAAATRYPVEENLLGRLEGAEVSAAGKTHTIRVIRNEAELERNKEQMGNCTDGYGWALEQGDVMLALLDEDGLPAYNAHLRRADGGFHVGEINSRRNRGEDTRRDIRRWLEQALESL